MITMLYHIGVVSALVVRVARRHGACARAQQAYRGNKRAVSRANITLAPGAEPGLMGAALDLMY